MTIIIYDKVAATQYCQTIFRYQWQHTIANVDTTFGEHIVFSQ